MLIRALEELKECKVDRATLDELIETKADRSSVEKKVSNWQFEQACQELSEGLGSMLDKMGSQVRLAIPGFFCADSSRNSGRFHRIPGRSFLAAISTLQTRQYPMIQAPVGNFGNSGDFPT